MNPGKNMTIYDIPGFVRIELPSVATPNNILAGFQSSCIWLYNTDIFKESEFTPS